MKISILTMLSLMVALFVVPFTTAMAAVCPNGMDYDLREGAVYFNENRVKRDDAGIAQQNRLVVFSRATDGTLTEVQRAESGGFGNDASIVTSGQFAVIISGQYVLMINPGFDPDSGSKDGSVSAFRIGECAVTWTDTESTKGQEPRSVTRDVQGDRDLVAVVNAGSGFVQFNGCPGLPVGFNAPTGIVCEAHAPVAEFDPTSYTIYNFDNGNGTFQRIAHADTRDEDGDPAQISFINEGRQLLISQRNTFFALGDGTEDDIMEVVKLKQNGQPVKDLSNFANGLANALGYNLDGASPDDIAPRFTNPVVSETDGNDNFGFSVFERSGNDYNDCVIMTHGSFQQRQQGGTSVFTVNEHGAAVRIIPNKPDSGDDTCWTAISSRTATVYASAFFNSEVSIRGFDFATCNITDGGPPIDMVNFTFAAPPGNSLTHRVSTHPNRDDEGGQQRSDTDVAAETSFPGNQSDFLYEAGGLDMDLTDNAVDDEFLYVVNALVPFAIGQNGTDDWLYFPEDMQLPICDFGTCTATDIAIYRVVEDCSMESSPLFGFDCRPGDLEFVGRSTPLPGSGFGVAAY